MSRIRSILQVNTRDMRGGAEQIAMSLHLAYRRRGFDARFAVGTKLGDAEGVLDLRAAEGRGAIERARIRIAHVTRSPSRVLDTLQGIETFHYPATRRLPDVTGEMPDILHLHNLHGGYFDLREMPRLGQATALVLTMHDAWLLSGHCGHSIDCGRWLTGCGECPDLTLYPAVRRDRTAHNWRRKQNVHAASRLFVTTPCRWLMDRVERSMLAAGIVDHRVIANGIDLSVFRPGDVMDARAALGLPREANVLLFVSAGIRRHPFKDFALLREAIGRIAQARDSGDTVFVALGEPGPAERIEGAEIRFVPFEPDAARIARYYQAADVYLHAARAETFPTVVLEALACGTPVVATAVGGIPEQVRDVGDERATGILTQPGDAVGLADAALRILRDRELRQRLGENAARDARERFGLDRMVDDYLDWYQTAREQWERASAP